MDWTGSWRMVQSGLSNRANKGQVQTIKTLTCSYPQKSNAVQLLTGSHSTCANRQFFFNKPHLIAFLIKNWPDFFNKRWPIEIKTGLQIYKPTLKKPGYT
jgi:hypothetical protein